MKRFLNRRAVVRPRIIETTYRVVRREDAAAPAAPKSAPLRPAGSFAELAANAYRQSRERGADARLNAVA